MKTRKNYYPDEYREEYETGSNVGHDVYYSSLMSYDNTLKYLDGFIAGYKNILKKNKHRWGV